jgi:hypothetical protein
LLNIQLIDAIIAFVFVAADKDKDKDKHTRSFNWNDIMNLKIYKIEIIGEDILFQGNDLSPPILGCNEDGHSSHTPQNGFLQIFGAVVKISQRTSNFCELGLQGYCYNLIITSFQIVYYSIHTGEDRNMLTYHRQQELLGNHLRDISVVPQ